MRGTIIGKDESGCYYLIDQVRPGFVTGFVLEPIIAAHHLGATRQGALESIFKPFWKGREDDSLPQFARDTYQERGEAAIWDLAGREFWDSIRVLSSLPPEEVPIFHTLACGLVFNNRVLWSEVFEPDLLWGILEWQDGNTSFLESATNGPQQVAVGPVHRRRVRDLSVPPVQEGLGESNQPVKLDVLPLLCDKMARTA